jgi:hypothetical protein
MNYLAVLGLRPGFSAAGSAGNIGPQRNSKQRDASPIGTAGFGGFFRSTGLQLLDVGFGVERSQGGRRQVWVR